MESFDLESDEEGRDRIYYDKVDNYSREMKKDDDSTPWLMSFADMVTLLMCFFILFFQTDQGNVKLIDPTEVRKKIEKLKV